MQFVLSAVAVLLDNADLALWAACRAVAWAPEGEDSGPYQSRFPSVDLGGSLLECLERFLTGINPWSVYLISGFGPYDDPSCDVTGATGMATEAFRATGGLGPDGRPGVVLPLDQQHLIKLLDTYVHGRCEEALCALVDLAGNILHELVHNCERDTNPDCTPEDVAPEFCCWQEQRMIGSMWEWAMAQRYPSLASTDGCHAGNICRFANSGWMGLQLVSTPGDDEVCP